MEPARQSELPADPYTCNKPVYFKRVLGDYLNNIRIEPRCEGGEWLSEAQLQRVLRYKEVTHNFRGFIDYSERLV